MKYVTKKVYALEPVPYEDFLVFLAGPTPRSNDVQSWRPEVIDAIDHVVGDEGFEKQISLLIPEDRSGEFHGNYLHQVEWEYNAIEACDVLLFWVPRSIDGAMPGFTTNVEFGYWLACKKHVVLGFPRDADSMRYLSWLYTKVKRRSPVHHPMNCAIEVTDIVRDS